MCVIKNYVSSLLYQSRLNVLIAFVKINPLNMTSLTYDNWWNLYILIMHSFIFENKIDTWLIV